MFESIELAARHLLWPAVIGLLLCAGLVLWSYARSSSSPKATWLAAVLKLLAFVILLLCLLEPVQRIQRPQPGANTLAILVDNSRSMQLKPSGERPSRAESSQRLLQSDNDWLTRISQDFSVKRYLFDQRIKAVDDYQAVAFDGQYSMLAASLSNLSDRFSRRPMAGVMLITDGLSTDDLAGLLERDRWSFPIYPVVDASSEDYCDIALGQATVSTSAFDLSPVTIETQLQTRGLAGQEVAVRIVDQDSQVIQRQTFRVDSQDHHQRLKFQFKTRKAGWQTVTLQARLVREESEPGKQPTNADSTEVTLDNNDRILSVDRGGGPYRILYVSGRPNWEFKFLRRALEEDMEVELHGLIRIAKKKPRFSFGDRSVSDVNPLKAGFDDNSDTAEQHDEPVLINIGSQESRDKLQAGFPSSAEQLFFFDGLILDDIESSFFTNQQLLLIRQFVSERGGGLMMLGGMESFTGGNYAATPLGDVLPVYMRGREPTVNKDRESRYQLTREGALLPWLRLRATEGKEIERFREMPNFKTWNAIADVKPGASTLAELEVDGHRLPGLVTQRFGKGQAAALMIGDFWRWSLHRESVDKDDLAQTWRQLSRWLTGDVPRRVEVDRQAPASPLEPEILTVKLRDAEYKPLDNANVLANIVEPDGQSVQISFQADAQRAGVYCGEYWSRSDGGYRCTIAATTSDGQALDTVVTGWTAQPSAAELKNVVADMTALERLAERSGGEVISLDSVDQFAKSLPTRKVPITQLRIEAWWHRPWLMGLALTCLCLEWAVRRMKGLP